MAFRDCDHCLEYLYDEKTGEPQRFRGELVKRGKTKPPCELACGCPKGKPGDGFSDKNLRALRFHRRCEAVGQWPDDSLVAANALTIQTAEAQAEVKLRKAHAASRGKHGHQPGRNDPRQNGGRQNRPQGA